MQNRIGTLKLVLLASDVPLSCGDKVIFRNSILQWIGFSLIIYVSAGCNLMSGNPKASDSTITFSNSGANCMSSALSNIQLFFAAEASDIEVQQSWECLAGAISLFEDHVVGTANETAFTPNEVRSFLEKYFMDGLTVSDQLLVEVMKIKQVIVGGSADLITRSDLGALVTLLRAFETETVALNKFMPILIMKQPVGTVSQADVDALEAQLIISGQNLGKVLNGSQNAYSIEDLKVFMQEMALLFGQLSSKWSGPQFIIDHLDDIANLKSLITAPNGYVVQPTEWAMILDSVPKLYAVWLRVSYVLNPTPYLTTGYGLNQLIYTVQRVVDVVQQAIDRKPNQQLDFGTINAVGALVFNNGIITDPKIKENTMLTLLGPIFFKVYSPYANGARPIPTGLDQRIFNMMKEDFFAWAQMQQLYDQIVTANPLASPPTLAQLKSSWAALTPSYTNESGEMNNILQRQYPQNFFENGCLILEQNVLDLPLTQESLTSLNWRRIFVSVLLRGYSSDPVKYHFLGLTLDEFHDFYLDVRQLGNDLQFLDPRNTSIYSGLFTQAHLFFLEADPTNLITFQQGMDLISFAMAAGHFSSNAYNDMDAKCEHEGIDVYGQPTLDVNCYRANFRSNFATYFPELTHWVKAESTWTDAQWASLWPPMETVARATGNSSQPLEQSDLSQTAMVFQYVESIFARFDADKSETINFTESLNFYPLLHGFIVQSSGLSDEGFVEAIFTYIMRYQEIPSTSILGLVELYLWKNSPSKWVYENDRITWVSIISALNAAENSSVAASPNDTVARPSVEIPAQIPASQRQDYYDKMFKQFDDPTELKKYTDQPDIHKELMKKGLIHSL